MGGDSSRFSEDREEEVHTIEESKLAQFYIQTIVMVHTFAINHSS